MPTKQEPRMPRVMGPNTLKWLMEKIPAFNETWKKTTHLREKMEREVTDKQKA